MFRKATNPCDRLAHLWCSCTSKLCDVYSVFYANHSASAQSSKQLVVRGRYGDHCIIPDQCQPSNEIEIKMFQPCSVGGMEKGAMGGNHKLAPVQRLGPSQIVKKEVNSVDMHDIGVANELDCRRR